MTMPGRTDRRCRTALSLALPSLIAIAPLPATAQDRAGACPDLSGHYRTDMYSPAQTDLLKALGAGMADFAGSEVMLNMSADGRLAVHVQSGSKRSMSAQPARVLAQGVDFDCRGGAVVLRQAVPAQRKQEQLFFEGRSSVRLAPGSPSGLNIAVIFEGSQRASVFSYESARLSLPRPGTGVTLTETLRWPDVGEPGPPPEPAPRPESRAEVEARRVLQPLLHPVMLGGLQPRGDAVLASLRAPTSAQAVRFEERLRQAGVPHEIMTAPVWSNGAYFMEVLIRPARPATPSAAAAPALQRPSPFWVTQTMNDAMQEAGLHVTGVEADGSAYVATLSVVGHPDVQRAIARLKLNADRFAAVVPLSEAPDALHPNVRVARWKVLLYER